MTPHKHRHTGLLGRLASIATSKHSLMQVAKDKRLTLHTKPPKRL